MQRTVLRAIGAGVLVMGAACRGEEGSPPDQAAGPPAPPTGCALDPGAPAADQCALLYPVGTLADGAALTPGLLDSIRDAAVMIPNPKPGPGNGYWERRPEDCPPNCAKVQQQPAINADAKSGQILTPGTLKGAWVIAVIKLQNAAQVRDAAYQLGRRPQSQGQIEREFMVVAKPLNGTPVDPVNPEVARLEVYGIQNVPGGGGQPVPTLFRVLDSEGKVPLRYVRQCHADSDEPLGAGFTGCMPHDTPGGDSLPVAKASMLSMFSFARQPQSPVPGDERHWRIVEGEESIWLSCAAGCCYAERLF